MSATRKSETVVMPVRSAMTAPSPICRVDGVVSDEASGLGWWQMVCPCEPMRSAPPPVGRYESGPAAGLLASAQRRVCERLADGEVQRGELRNIAGIEERLERG